MKVVRWVLLALAIIAVAGGAYVCNQVRQHPLAVAAKIGKKELERGGLERAELEGGLVIWKGGANGPVLVFLHGANDNAGSWGKVAPAFAEQFHVVVVDLPGHGESEPQTGPLTLADLRAAVARVVANEAKGEPAVLVGNSLGALLAMVHAYEKPAEVARLVAINGGAITGDPEEAARLFPQTREDARALVELLRDPKSPAVPDFVLDDIVRMANDGPLTRLARDAQGVASVLLDDKLQDVRVPSEIVWGASDRLMPIAYAERLAAGLPTARLTTIEQCGHVPQVECPDKLIETLRQVLVAPPPAYKEPPVEALPAEGFR